MRGCAAAAAGLKMPCLLRRMSIRAALRRGAKIDSRWLTNANALLHFTRSPVSCRTVGFKCPYKVR